MIEVRKYKKNIPNKPLDDNLEHQTHNFMIKKLQI